MEQGDEGEHEEQAQGAHETSRPSTPSTVTATAAAREEAGAPTTWRGNLVNFDSRNICRVQAQNVPFPMDRSLVISERFRPAHFFQGLERLPYLRMTVQPEEEAHRKAEWINFLTFLWREVRVAVVRVSGHELVLQVDESPREGHPNFLTAFYAPFPPGLPRRHMHGPSAREAPPAAQAGGAQPALQPVAGAAGHMHPRYLETIAHAHSAWAFGALAELIDNAKDAGASRLEISIAHGEQPAALRGTEEEEGVKAEREEEDEAGSLEDPLAPLVPMLCVCDNGCGMRHADVVQMLSLGHEPPPEEEKQRIGRFGVGFKSGSMRLGQDVLVLTQCRDSRTIALLSRTLNHNRQAVEIPLISYRRRAGGGMVLDPSVCTPEQETRFMNHIQDLTPLDRFRIGQEFFKLEEAAAAQRAAAPSQSGAQEGQGDQAPGHEAGDEAGPSVEDGGAQAQAQGQGGAHGGGGRGATGTRIFILGLRKVQGNFELDWDSDAHDLLIRSRRARSRTNQLCEDVPLDYSLRTYLKHLFLPPSEEKQPHAPPMDIFLQGEKAETGVDVLQGARKVMRYAAPCLGQRLVMRLGFSPPEKAAMRCGVFLYWRGRLIEAYRRVGTLEFDKDAGLGVLGVLDTTPVLEATQGGGVVNCKQRFLDTPELEELLKWVAARVNKYWDKNFCELQNQVVDPASLDAPVEPVCQWVECDLCKKWRRLPPGQDSPAEGHKWFCAMLPGLSCAMPQEDPEDGEFTTAIIRDGDVVGHQLPSARGAQAHRSGGTTRPRDSSRAGPRAATAAAAGQEQAPQSGPRRSAVKDEPEDSPGPAPKKVRLSCIK